MILIADNAQPGRTSVSQEEIYMELTETKKLTRGKSFIAGGVCAGLASYFGLKKGGVQACFLLGSVFFGSTIVIYLVLWLLMPKDKSLS